jgi:hypothetical protein
MWPAETLSKKPHRPPKQVRPYPTSKLKYKSTKILMMKLNEDPKWILLFV